MAQWMADAAVGAAVLLGGLGLLLATLGFLTAQRLRSGRLALVAVAFLGFAAQGLWLGLDAYARRSELAAGGAASALGLPALSLAIVLLLYAAVLKR